MFKGFIFEYLHEDIEANLDPRQFGFRFDHNTTHYFVCLLDDLMRPLEKEETYTKILLGNIVKAFDSITQLIATDRAQKWVYGSFC